MNHGDTETRRFYLRAFLCASRVSVVHMKSDNIKLYRLIMENICRKV